RTGRVVPHGPSAPTPAASGTGATVLGALARLPFHTRQTLQRNCDASSTTFAHARACSPRPLVNSTWPICMIGAFVVKGARLEMCFERPCIDRIPHALVPHGL